MTRMEVALPASYEFGNSDLPSFTKDKPESPRPQTPPEPEEERSTSDDDAGGQRCEKVGGEGETLVLKNVKESCAGVQTEALQNDVNATAVEKAMSKSKHRISKTVQVSSEPTKQTKEAEDESGHSHRNRNLSEEDRKKRLSKLIAGLQRQTMSLAFSGHQIHYRRGPGSNRVRASKSLTALNKISADLKRKPEKEQHLASLQNLNQIQIRCPTPPWTPVKGLSASPARKPTEDKKQQLFWLGNKPPPKHPVQLPETYKKGTVPRYLLRRRKEWARQEAQEEERRKKEALPVGHTLMEERERLATLKGLEEKRSTLERELVMLPVALDTNRVKRLKQNLEEELAKVDDGIRIFSKPQVFIKLPDGTK
ncbi:unnamed protein product [Cyprideis torosa]|uniref:Uncharacterized protein n=1 Tax=Cyprideis torosa TaxID=163714 RepID=A0A7R8W8U0_9CRUS|nr:unnamed protein product [Cyprideis torosa]CAG0883550.1 unnamed protein product [Cyprideis torosa]